MTAAEAGRRHGWNLALFGAAALCLLIWGNPAETLERQLFDAALRARAAFGWTPATDSRVVVLGADDIDLAALGSLEEEYRAAARAIVSGLEDLRNTFDPDTRALFGYGVALNAGPSLIGKIGSSHFFHYGPVGDLLNATARVESLTKYYGVLVLVTRAVYDRFSSSPEARVLDRVVVKGKTEALELLELRNPTSPSNFSDIASSYAEAYSAYQARDFEGARRMFERTNAFDPPSAVLALRCEELQRNRPERWDGAYTFLTK